MASINVESLCWKKNPLGWFKFNVDGAVSLHSFRAGCGGVMRDASGKWVVGFTKELGIWQAFSAEVWAILEGLMIAWDMGFKNIIIETDAEEVVQFILEGTDSESLQLLKIRELLRKDWNVIVQFISRDCNRVADTLAKLGIAKSSILEVCPSYVGSWIYQECLGLISPYV